MDYYCTGCCEIFSGEAPIQLKGYGICVVAVPEKLQWHGFCSVKCFEWWMSIALSHEAGGPGW